MAGDLSQFVPANAREDRRWPLFQRGFPERITVSAETFLQHHDRLFRAGPIRGAWLHATDRVPWTLFDCPGLARLTAAGLGPWAFGLARMEFTGLHETPNLNGLNELWLDCDLSAHWWNGRRYVPADDLTVASFAPKLNIIRLLRPSPDGYTLSGIHRLPALRELWLGQPDDSIDWRPATERSAWFPTLERFHVSGVMTNPLTLWTDGQLADVSALPGLQAIEFVDVNLSEAVTAGWDAASLWRSVQLSNAGLTAEHLTTLLTADPLAECGCLDISHNPGAGAILAAVGGAPCASGLLSLTAAGYYEIGDHLSRFVRGRPLPVLSRLDIHHDGHHAQPLPPATLRALLDGDVCPGLVSLAFRNIGPDAIEAVAGSPGAGRLRELVLSRIGWAEAKLLAASPHLDGLELFDVIAADRATGEILRDRFGRRLRVTNG